MHILKLESGAETTQSFSASGKPDSLQGILQLL